MRLKGRRIKKARTRFCPECVDTHIIFSDKVYLPLTEGSGSGYPYCGICGLVLNFDGRRFKYILEAIDGEFALKKAAKILKKEGKSLDTIVKFIIVIRNVRRKKE